MEVRRRRKPCTEALRTVPFPVAASSPRGLYADAAVFFASDCQIKWNSSRGTTCHPTCCRACAKYLRRAAFVRGGAGVRIYLQEEPPHGRA